MKDPFLDYSKIPPPSDRLANRIFLTAIKIVTLPLVIIAWLCRMEGATASVVYNKTADHYVVVKDIATGEIATVVPPGQVTYWESSIGVQLQARAVADNGLVDLRDSVAEYVRVNLDGSMTAADVAFIRPALAPAAPAWEEDSFEAWVAGFGLGALCMLVRAGLKWFSRIGDTKYGA